VEQVCGVSASIQRIAKQNKCVSAYKNKVK